ncbi:MAG: hypothetical protein A2044_08805 [Candidatus Firestonebacteria bacterium GWA2_43_8]|nr:MAG: hypothetical protein A2044_08805 [Candidatus Firestonebacteria bacterium GWA2_43_8]
MPVKKSNIVSFIKTNGGFARFSVLIKAGFHRDTISASVKKGLIRTISRGIYQLSDYDIGEYPDLVQASLQSPKGIVCLISALAFHEATNEIPRYVDMAIPSYTRANKVKYPPVKFYRFDMRAYEAGVEEHKVGSQKFRVYSLAKTIADCFKFRNRIGMNVVRNAMKTAILEKKVKTNEIMKFAKICRVDNVIKPIIEAML